MTTNSLCKGELSKLDLAMLAYPFRRDDHEFLQSYVYIQEEAITERLDAVDPNWSLTIDEAIAYGDSIVFRSTLTVKGVSRSNAGGNPVQREKNDKTLLGQYAVADNGVNAHKAAATDALKRCARMFGVGRYLLSAPKEGKAFDDWLAEEHKAAKAKLDALRSVDATTGEITPKPGAEPPAPNASASPSSTATGKQGGDAFGKQFPPSRPVTAEALWDAAHDFFDNKPHFNAHWAKHSDTYATRTLEEALAWLRDYHWNYNVDAVKRFVAEADMENAQILEALGEACGHTLKRFRDWDGGSVTVARGALLAWQSGYDAVTVNANAHHMGTAADVVQAAEDVCEAYAQKHPKAEVTT